MKSSKFFHSRCLRVKKIESGINHDVKAVEYFIKEQIGSGNKELGQVK